MIERLAGCDPTNFKLQASRALTEGSSRRFPTHGSPGNSQKAVDQRALGIVSALRFAARIVSRTEEAPLQSFGISTLTFLAYT